MQSRLRKRGRRYNKYLQTKTYFKNICHPRSAGKILVYPHDPEAGGRAGDRGEDPGGQQGVLPPPRPDRPPALHRGEDPPLLHVQLPVLPAGHVRILENIFSGCLDYKIFSAGTGSRATRGAAA